MIQLLIEGTPIPWKAPYVGTRGAFSPRYKEMQMFRFLVKQQYKGEVLLCAVMCEMKFFMPIPKATSNKRRLLMIDGDIRPTARPDRTNCAKLFEDCLNGIVIKDDSQIVGGNISKWYGEEPRTEITIWKL
jgi:Holliday junction resolvase RusA-like endonuclease